MNNDYKTNYYYNIDLMSKLKKITNSDILQLTIFSRI